MSKSIHQDRYARQVQFAPIGTQGQQRISQSTIATLGCGALGTVAAEILVRAGVGCLRIIDRDVVEWTNLQRQALFDQRDASDAVSKSQAACEHLALINDQVKLEPRVADVTPDNISELLSGVDLVIDATDNFAIRFLLNDWSLKNGKPWVHGGCVGGAGQVRLFRGDGPPCFRCLVPDLPPAASVDTCDSVGVLGSATHAIASLQATEAIKWISGNEQQVSEDVLSIDFWNNRVRQVKLSAELSENCPACRHHRYEFLDGERLTTGDGVLCGRDAVQISRPTASPVDLAAVAKRWSNSGRVQSTRFFVRLFPSDAQSVTLFRDGRVVVQGTTDVSTARMLYDRFIGG
ncbi:ThiF family adenylyltransferase [Stieleria varia]|nr:ThiF family adenylyltransferase [Stieleria varia]